MRKSLFLPLILLMTFMVCGPPAVADDDETRFATIYTDNQNGSFDTEIAAPSVAHEVRMELLEMQMMAPAFHPHGYGGPCGSWHCTLTPE